MPSSARTFVRSLIAITASVGAMTLVSGCASNSSVTGDAPSTPDASIAVMSSDDACDIATTDAPAGVLQFSVTNTGSQVTEFYVLAEDGLQVLGEVENIAPGLSRDLVLQASPGSYTLACKPGSDGDGIRSPFTVTESGVDTTPTAEDAALITAATSAYAAYVKDQTEQLLADTKRFARAYAQMDDDVARSLYASARMHWERIEPVAESFGDLDPILDAREADLEEGQQWTGWHRIEKDLWPPATGYRPNSAAERTALAEALVDDTTLLYDRTREMTFTIDQLGNGAKELLDEVATGKITGEEEIWSHTDLWDFQANIDGARVMYAGLKPLLERRDPGLASRLDEQFTSMQALLDEYRIGDGFVLYTDLTPPQIKELAAAVSGLGEPISRLTSAVLVTPSTP